MTNVYSKNVPIKVRTSRTKIVKGIKPQLTSLVDVMTILLIYLLKSFSADGEIIVTSSLLELPKSTSKLKPQSTVMLVVTKDNIVAESEPLCTISSVENSTELIIPQLNNWLEKRRLMTKQIENYSDRITFNGAITIQADIKIQFNILKKLMYTCGQQQYTTFYLAVKDKEE